MALIFQYGSNTSTERLNAAERLAGAAQPLTLATTVGEFDLAFTYPSKGNACAAADLIGGTTVIVGVLYEIPNHRVFRHLGRNGEKTLDQIEGTGYGRELIKIRRADTGEIVNATTYLVVDRQTNIATAPHYVSHIVAGLRAHGAPDSYIDYVKRRAAINNPAAARMFELL